MIYPQCVENEAEDLLVDLQQVPAQHACALITVQALKPSNSYQVPVGLGQLLPKEWDQLEVLDLGQSHDLQDPLLCPGGSLNEGDLKIGHNCLPIAHKGIDGCLSHVIIVVFQAPDQFRYSTDILAPCEGCGCFRSCPGVFVVQEFEGHIRINRRNCLRVGRRQFL